MKKCLWIHRKIHEIYQGKIVLCVQTWPYKNSAKEKDFPQA